MIRDHDALTPEEKNDACRDLHIEQRQAGGDELAACLELALRYTPNDPPGRSLRRRACRAMAEWDELEGGLS